jgi:hypothetical protein
VKSTARFLLPPLVLALLAAGCVSKKMSSRSSGMEYAMADYVVPAAAPVAGGQPAARERLRIWKAWVSLEVANVSNAVHRAIAFAEQQGGYVEQKSGDFDQNAYLKLRVPAAALTPALDAMQALGRVLDRRLENQDVTEQYVDTEARLKNRLVLRDRLRTLLDQATEVKDLLAIETELNRVQGDIDSMTARLQALQGQIDFAALDLSFQRRPVPGPLGLLFKGLFWTVEKLFVLRD